MPIGRPAKNNADQLRRELIPVLEFFNCPQTGSFAADIAILLGKLSTFAQSFGHSAEFMDTYYRLTFAYYDKDGNGTIDREEWKLIMDDMEKLTNKRMEQSADQVFDSVDVNGDGVIDFSEYLTLIQMGPTSTASKTTSSTATTTTTTTTDEQKSTFMESLNSVIEFLGIVDDNGSKTGHSIIADLSNISTYVQNKDSKTIAQSIRERILDSLLGFYVSSEESAAPAVIDDETFALVSIDYADLTGIGDITGYVNECSSRKRQLGTDLTRDQAKEVIAQVDAL